jgi:hypothetical protein
MIEHDDAGRAREAGPSRLDSADPSAVVEPTTIPADSYFLLGDNRNNSEDSRFFGFVDRDRIKGRVHSIYWSWDMGDPAAPYRSHRTPPLRTPVRRQDRFAPSRVPARRSAA